MKIVVIGSEGRMGTLRSNILKSRGVEVVGIDPVIQTNYEYVLRMEHADGYIVATPLGTHFSIIRSIISRGVPIFCEKPLCGSVEEITELFDQASGFGTPIYVAWQRRLHKDYINMKYTLDNVQKDWRKIHIVSGDNPSPPEHVLSIPNYIHSDFMGHDINELLWMTDNAVPEACFVANAKLFGSGKYDASTVFLKYSGDRIAILEGFTENPGNFYRQELEIITPKNVIRSERVENKRSFPEFYKDAFEAEVDLFIDVVEGKCEFPEQREQNIMTAKMIEMIIKASESNQNVLQSKKDVIEFLGGGNFGSYIHETVGKVVPVGEMNTRYSGRHIEELIADPNVKRVYVCTPDNTHDLFAKDLLFAGKHVLCEKPIFQFENIAAIAEDRNVAFQIGFQRRFDVEYRAAAKFATDNANKISRVTIRSYDPVPFDDDSEFVISNSLIHDFDILNVMFPTAYFTICEVRAEGSTITVDILVTIPDVGVDGGNRYIIADIDYCKECDSYVQQVIIEVGEKDTYIFGFDYALRNGVKVFDSYRTAYQDQFKFFNTQTEYNPGLVESYRKTIQMVRDTLAKL